MMTKNTLIAFLPCVVALFAVIPNSTFAQSEPWEESLVSAHTVMSININVARLCDYLEEGESRKQVAAFLEGKKGIKLAELDQFQYFLSTPPELPTGADENGNMQLTFRKAQKFNAESVGKMSGYRVTAESLGDQGQYNAFLGNSEWAGAWGAVVVNDRTLVFAVRRKMISIIESQSLKRRPEHVLSKTSKDNRDIFVTISGGKKIKAVFEEAWRTDEYSEIFDLYENAWIDFDSQSDTAISAVIEANDEASALRLQAMLGEQAKRATAMLAQLQQMFGYAENDQRNKDIETGISILDTLKISTEGKTLKISSNEVTGQQLVPMLIRIALL